MSRVILVLLMVLLAASGAGSAATPHVLTIADGGDLDTLNPHISNGPVVANLSEMTMAWLLKWDEHNRLEPELATEVPTKANKGVSADGRTITYHLRKGVLWSDGAPFDADDVIFTTSVVANPANKEPGRFDQLDRADAPDKYTVVFHLKTSYAPATASYFSSCCANAPILPKHLLAQYPNINDVPYNDLPVGIGPFKFERWERSKQVVMVANPLYWRGRPKLDSIIYKIVPDRNALLAQVQASQVDMWYQFSGSYLPRIQTLSDYTVFRQPSYAYNHFDFNVTHAAVSDARVRRALRLALNRPYILNTIEHGIGVLQDSATPVTAPYYVRTATAPYDPAKASLLLDRAGWKRGADRIRVKNGVRLDLTLATRAGAPDLDEQIAALAADWKKIGAAITVKHYPATEFFSKVINSNSWDVTTFAWAADPIGDYSAIYGCGAFPPGGQNNIRWCNRSAQAAMDHLLRNDDQAGRAADVAVEMREFNKDVPSIISYMRVDLFAYRKDLKNYRPNNLTPFDNMMDVDI